MNLTIAYTCVTSPILGLKTDTDRDYDNAALRFADAFTNFEPKTPGQFAVIACGQSGLVPSRFDLWTRQYIRYLGNAKDCGAYLFAAQHIETEWVLLMNSHVYWTQPDAIDKLLAARAYGDCLYGPWGSYEVMPHIRSACMLVKTEHLRSYPHTLQEPHDANRFECGDLSFTNWMERNNRPALMVTRDGVYAMKDWRKPQNVFRNGDQSACLLFDRHTQLYEAAGPLARKKLQDAADGL